MSFRKLCGVVFLYLGSLGNPTRLGREPVFTQAQTHLGEQVPRPIGPQMCFWPVPGRTDVLNVLYLLAQVISAWQAPPL